MTNKLAKTVMGNISKKNLNKGNRSHRGRRIERKSPYGRIDKADGEYSNARDMKARYDQQKTISLSNYSSSNASKGSSSKIGSDNTSSDYKTNKAIRQRTMDLSCLAREIKGEDREVVEDKRERSSLEKSGRNRITLDELSQIKAGKSKETNSSKDKPESKKDARKRNLTLDSLARIHKEK